MSHQVTIRDVARLACTSVSTVSAAFSSTSSIAPATRERVVLAADELGWRPDRRASRLRRSSVNIIGVVYEVGRPFQASLVESLYQVAAEQDVELFLAGATGHHSELRCLDLLTAERCSGVVLIGAGPDPEVVMRAAKAVPIVSLCRTINLPGVDEVYSDVRTGQRKIVDHLFKLGHRDILYVGAPGRPTSVEREAAFRDAMDEFGLDSTKIWQFGDGVEDGIRAADRFVAITGASPTATIMYNDVAASGFVSRLRQRGFQVPQDVSVVGYDDAPLAADPTLDLTTVQQPRLEMAHEAMRLMQARIGGHLAAGAEEIRLAVSTKLVVRQTTSTPNSSFETIRSL